jgi:hypothetical protein
MRYKVAERRKIAQDIREEIVEFIIRRPQASLSVL